MSTLIVSEVKMRKTILILKIVFKEINRAHFAKLICFERFAVFNLATETINLLTTVRYTDF